MQHAVNEMEQLKEVFSEYKVRMLLALAFDGSTFTLTLNRCYCDIGFP